MNVPSSVYFAQPLISALAQPFRARWVWSLVWAIGFALVIWFFGALVAVGNHRPLEGDLVRLIACCAVFATWAAFNLQVNLKARQTDRRMVHDLTDPSEEEKRRGADAASAEELRLLRDRLQEALSQLRKKAGRKGMGRGYLYQLPWYIMVGPPGSGKTSALLTSGLNFPLSTTIGRDPLKGIGGTRNCDWWFTDEAILLDTAGRYTTQDSDPHQDQAAWLGFLDLLKSYRPRQPVNGAIVVMSLADLMAPDPTERLNHARAIRLRLNELYDRFGLRFPVYMLFTKVDLVPGFVEYFDNLGKSEREQVWGMTFPLDDGAADSPGVVEQFPQELEGLVIRLNERLLERVQQEADIERRGLVFNFPNQVASLSDALLEILTEIFRASPYETRPLLRGSYFTSSVQVGMPIDRTMATIAATFGLDPVRMPANNRQGRSYFLTRLFNEVIFAEAAVVSLNPKVEQRRRRLRIATYASAAVILAVLAYAWSTGYQENKRQVALIDDGLQAYDKAATGIPSQGVTDADLVRVVKPLNILRNLPTGLENNEGVASQWLTFGLYQGDKLKTVHAAVYHRALNGLMLPRLLVRLQEQIQAHEDDDDFVAGALKIYLMLGSRGPLDANAVRQWMVADWAATWPGEANKGLRDDLARHLDSLLTRGSLTPIPLDANLITQSRRSLEKLAPAERVYALVRQHEGISQLPQWRPVDHAGATADHVFTRVSGKPLTEGIPGLYTPEGYKAFQPALSAVIAEVQGQSWVLGDKPAGANAQAQQAAQADDLRERVTQLYYADYIQQWDAMLGDLRIVPLADMQQTIAVLNLVSSPDMPMLKLLKDVAAETQIVPLPGLPKTVPAPGGAAAPAALPTPDAPAGAVAVAQHFQPIADFVTPSNGAPARAEDLVRLLGEAYQELSNVASGPGNGRMAMYTRASHGGAGGPIQMLNNQAAQMPRPVNGWIATITGSASEQSVGGARAQLSNLWGGEVGGFCTRAVNGRYPFAKDSTKEISVGDFTRLFAPNGMLDNFFNNHLKTLVDTSGAKWRWTKVGDTGLGIPDSVLASFQYAAQIRDAFFPDGGQQPRVALQVTPVTLDPKSTGVLFASGGQQIEYQHGPQWPASLQWPDNDPNGVSRVVFEVTDGLPQSVLKSGPWSLFHLVDQGTVTPLGSDNFRVNFASGTHNAGFEVKSSTSLNPFILKELRAFRCPVSF
ncbi:type VI secretion system membrane subunit TssM [Nitrospirillum viridazoti]|uniref:Type VI secretion system protein ImpL n=1 Tax=Nitrospirillum amazonense TaxID=28077 RepID=A0A560IFC8_9PROT|nr:type VI secretion system membrane subunit TssM [Nitrospirillum amazonense]TWB56719.1 type VI secretion system protein ImpL [Nitrospirillum amazonense]